MAILSPMNLEGSRIETTPRFQNIPGGGSTVPVNAAYTARTNPDDPTGKIHSFCQRFSDSAKQFRNNFDENWDTYYNMLQGNQWVQPGSSSTALRAPRIQSWRARMNINYVYPIMDDIASIVFDQDPRLSLTATSPEQAPYVDSIQAALDDVWYWQKGASKCRQAFFNALTYGNGYLKVTYDPEENQGEGQILISLVPTQNIFVEKVCTTFHDCEKVLEISVRSLAEVMRMHPDKARLLKPDISKGSYAEQLTEDGLANNTLNQSLQIFTPADDNPRIADKTIFSNPPYKRSQGRDDTLIEVGELWCKDYSLEEYEEQYIAGYDAWRRPMHGTRKKKRRKYPYGRIITYGGGLVLQDKKNPYRTFPPYVLFQDIINTGVFYAKGEPELLYDPQRELNKRRSQIMDNAAFTGNAVWIVDKSTGVPPSMLMNTPGLIIPVAQGTINQIRRENPPEMPAWILQAAEKPIQDMMFMSGVSQGAPRGGRSGSAIQEGMSAATRRTRMKSKQVEDALTDLGQVLITFIQDFYTTAKMVRIMGNMGSAAFVPFDRFHIRGQWDIRVEATNTAMNSKIQRRQEAIQLYSMGLIDDRAILEALEWPGREEILRRKGRPGQPHQFPQYPGWPGMPYLNRQDSSGYSLAARYEPPQPPPAPMGPQGGPAGFQQPKPQKKSRGAGKGSTNPFAGKGFGK